MCSVPDRLAVDHESEPRNMTRLPRFAGGDKEEVEMT
jgi:hypothetical protein